MEKLEEYVAGKQGIEDVYQGQVKGNKEFLSLFSNDADLQQAVERWISNRKVAKLLELWVKGLEVDWSKLYGESRPQRMRLPAYPFARERYWIETAAVGKQAAVNGAATATAVLHPLLHSNTSDLREQSYSVTFSGEEFFLKDHQVEDHRVLPAGAYLEMARVAVQKAARSSLETGLELRNVVWAQPVVVGESKQVNIALLASDNDEIDFEIYSQDGDEEIIHCQGRAAWSQQAPPTRLDIEQFRREMSPGGEQPSNVYATCAGMGLIYGPSLQAITGIHLGNNQVLAQLRLPSTVADGAGEYVLHPSLIEGALQAALAGSEGGRESRQPQLPVTLESLRIISACSREMVAWVRYAPGGQGGDKMAKLDIDLCDERGNVCAQMRGVSWQPVSLVPLSIGKPAVEKAALAVDAPQPPKKITAIPQVPREIVFLADKPVIAVQAKREKPRGIGLVVPGTLREAAAISSEARKPAAGKPSITLAAPTRGVTVSESDAGGTSSVRLHDEGLGIFSIQVATHGTGNPSARETMAHLLQALERAEQEISIKVLKLSGLERCFRRGGREDYNQAVEQKLYQALVTFPYPVIAVLREDMVGAGLLAAALCDFMVCNEDATYGYTDLTNDFYPTVAEAMLLEERFGRIQAHDLLYLTMAATGWQLRAKGWTCPIVAREQIEAYAQNLAATLATKSQNALRLLKQHLTRSLAGVVKELTYVEAAAPATEHPSETFRKDISFAGRAYRSGESGRQRCGHQVQRQPEAGGSQRAGGGAWPGLREHSELRLQGHRSGQ